MAGAGGGGKLDEKRPKLDDFTIYDDGMVWNASLVMLNHFRTKMADHWRGRRVLELGSGLGHLAWGLYKMGAHVTCTDTPMGDLAQLRARVRGWLEEEEKEEGGKESSAPKGSIRVEELTWGEQHWAASPLSKEPLDGYDTVILAEVFSIPDIHEELLWTLQRFCRDGIEAWSIFMNRPFSFMFFTHVADAGGFRVQQLEDIDMCGMDDEELGVFMHRLTYDTSSPRLAAKKTASPA